MEGVLIKAEADTPRVLTRHLAEIESALRASSPLTAGSWLGRMAAYHMGWINHEGKATASNGKRLRPSLCLWTAEACGSDPQAAMGAALAVEWIHNFTLIHDDIQDVSHERRHRPTVWSIWGSAQAINAGDGLFALAFNALLDGGAPAPRRLQAAQVITAAVMEVIEGQCLDLASEGLPQTPPQRYMKLITAKTGALVGAAVEAGAVMAGAPASVRKGLRRAGRFLGLAFQVRDDWLGVWGDPRLTGKSRDGDLAQRKLSHPVVAAYAVADRSQRAAFRRMFLDRKPGGEERIRELLEQLGGPGLTAAAPGELARAAVSALRQAGRAEPSVQEFAQVARYAAERTG